MITIEQALTANEFHEEGWCERLRTRKWRRNGKTQTWKRDPKRFRIPVKYGMYDYGEITNDNADKFHTVDDCPDVIAEKAALMRALPGLR